ncbi:hypothetical protein OD91_2672 [Lutibacter sp. Hel_I_33_5]|uniref:hypothetical protein n=1 Tax=Lutibacter sp. Hel_I_33_5 TaxID=1566289 RepID=UPI00119ED5B0|nr:hypothetical protein [Lutibacter sp. Hel_I_33_5]TVZ57351.1 hypothetical protein OD91_2672 [Lutibacter sp. Hel_I_33_5]
MKNVTKFIVTICFLSICAITNAQKNNNNGVSFVLDMQPVLQMDMTAPEQINFVFDEKSKYYKGIEKNKATVLKVTSTVKWDLYAVGRSTNKNTNEKTFWNQQESYGPTTNSVADLPLSLLEIKQSNVNKGAEKSVGPYADYSRNFSNEFRTSASNSLYVSEDGLPSPPSKSGKYLAGHSGVAQGDKYSYMEAGSYLSDGSFSYEIDYRILPSYPAVFPNAYNEDATVAQNVTASANASSVLAGGLPNSGNKSYAEPGSYTMNVQYILLEDQ